jgi:hypothetical protein
VKFAYHVGRLLAIGMLFSLAGCGSSTVPVTGTVKLDGKPLAGVEVVFHPDPQRGNSGDSASGFTDDQGRYTLLTARTSAHGAAPGYYRVVITAINTQVDLTAEPAAAEGLGSVQPQAGKRPSLPGLYSDLGQTPFRDIEVKSGTPFDFELKSSAR